MLLLPLFLFGLASGLAAALVILAMRRAERRARHTLYAALGYGEELILALMAQKGPISAQLAVVRRTSIVAASRPDEAPGRVEGAQTTAQRSLHYTRALNGTRARRDRLIARDAGGNPHLDRGDPS